MSAPFLNLLVLRAPDIEKAQRFYSLLGLSFTKHAHGNGPEHYAADTGSQVLELYPQADTESSTKSTRVGFRVHGVDEMVVRLVEGGATIISPARDSQWGRRAVVCDPIGHKLELLEGDVRERTKRPNKAPEPTSTSGTPRAISRVSEMKQRTENRTKARVVPAVAVAHL